MREEREDLKEAAEQTLNIIVDLDLEGRIKWVSPSWRQVVGTAPASVEGRMISEILLGNKEVFKDAIDALKEDDSRSRFIRFAVQMGPDSVLKYAPEPRPVGMEQKQEDDNSEDTTESSEPSQVEGEQNNDVLTMEGQGIMVYERDDDGHVGCPHIAISFLNYLTANSRVLLTLYIFNTVDVDVTSIHRTERSDYRSSAPPCRVARRRSRSPRELPNNPRRSRCERTRPFKTPRPNTRAMSDLRASNYAMVVRETLGSVSPGTSS